MDLKERLLRLGYSSEDADKAISAHIASGKLFELERLVYIKEDVAEVMG